VHDKRNSLNRSPQRTGEQAHPRKIINCVLEALLLLASAEIFLFDWVIFSLQMRGAHYNTRHMLSETDMTQVAKCIMSSVLV